VIPRVTLIDDHRELGSLPIDDPEPASLADTGSSTR
jgi:hypothetical protein